MQYLSLRMCWGWKHSCVLSERWSAGWCVGMCVSGGPAVLPLSGEGPRLAGRENNTEPSAGQSSPPWLCWGGNGFNYPRPYLCRRILYLRPTLWHCKRDVFSTSRMKGLHLSVYNWDWVVTFFRIAFFVTLKHWSTQCFSLISFQCYSPILVCSFPLGYLGR